MGIQAVRRFECKMINAAETLIMQFSKIIPLSTARRRLPRSRILGKILVMTFMGSIRALLKLRSLYAIIFV